MVVPHSYLNKATQYLQSDEKIYECYYHMKGTTEPNTVKKTRLKHFETLTIILKQPGPKANKLKSCPFLIRVSENISRQSVVYSVKWWVTQSGLPFIFKLLPTNPFCAGGGGGGVKPKATPLLFKDVTIKPLVCFRYVKGNHVLLLSMPQKIPKRGCTPLSLS